MPEVWVVPCSTSVSSAPQSLPLAKVTCCMRESFTATLRGATMFLTTDPICGAQVGEAMQSRSGVLPGFWAMRAAGTAYGCTVSAETESDNDAGAVSMALVLEMDHTSRSLEMPSSKNTASELRKNSVPPLSREFCPAGEVAGQTVNAGARSEAWSKSTTLALVPAASARLEMA